MRAILALALVFLSVGTGCSSPTLGVGRKVYHTIPHSGFLRGKSYHLVFMKGAQEQSLECRSHAKFLDTQLKAAGLIKAKPGGAADLTVLILFKSESDDKIRTRYTPIFATSGGQSSFSSTTFGSGGPVTTYGTVTTPTVTSQVGGVTSVESYTEFAVMFAMDIISNKSGEPIYQGAAGSESEFGDTTRIIPILIKTLMHGFPSASGQFDQHSYWLESGNRVQNWNR